MNVYLDHAATTPVDSRVTEAMLPYFSGKYGNASSLYSMGSEAKGALESSRKTVAKLINCAQEEICFTSGGTESDNLAVKGAAYANRGKGSHIITSAIEHHAVLHTCQYLEKNGFKITYLPVDKYGLVSPADVEKAITPKTTLISVMLANNEIGTIEPISEIGKIAREHGVLFHTDAVQATGHIPIDVKKLNLDLLSSSAHKLYGPKGVGSLYVRNGVKLEPILHGGGHERNLRSGTENVAGIVGYAKACELAINEMDGRIKTETLLRDRLIKGILEIEDSHLNGHPKKRLPGNANFRFKYIEGEGLILHLDDRGISASTGSACSTKSLEPSHVLLATGLSHVEAHGSLRLTIGRENTKEQIDFTIKSVKGVVDKLRELSPFKK
ncbi:MAG: cysteine desulfurase NifS [archaeon]